MAGYGQQTAGRYQGEVKALIIHTTPALPKLPEQSSELTFLLKIIKTDQQLSTHTRTFQGKFSFLDIRTAPLHAALINQLKDTGDEGNRGKFRRWTVLFLPLLASCKKNKSKGEVFGSGGERGMCFPQPNSKPLHFSMPRTLTLTPSSYINTKRVSTGLKIPTTATVNVRLSLNFTSSHP